MLDVASSNWFDRLSIIEVTYLVVHHISRRERHLETSKGKDNRFVTLLCR